MESNNQTWWAVEVQFFAGNSIEVHQDGIRGTDPIDALKNAYANWTDAIYIRVTGKF